MRRGLRRGSAVAGAAAAACLGLAGPTYATPTGRVQVTPTAEPVCTPYDVNGDGVADIAVGVPGEDVGRAVNAGAVNVLFGRADGSYGTGVYLTQESVGLISERGDSFGAAVALADVTYDRCVDLIIGVPGEDRSAGQVVVLRGSPSGLRGNRPIVLRQGRAGTPGRAEAGDRFGAAISVQTKPDFLWVGTPGEDVGRVVDAGAVTRFPAQPLTTRDSVQLHQGFKGWPIDVPGVAEAGDNFGASIAGGTLIGAPGEDVGRITDAGSVVRMDMSLQKFVTVTQASPGIPDAPEAGDRFGATLASRVFPCQHDYGTTGLTVNVIGAPGEDRGSTADAGYVIHTGGGRSQIGYDPKYYDWVSVPAPGGAGDRFGGSLALSGTHLVVGAPGRDVAGALDAGQVVAYPISVGCSMDFDFSWSVRSGPGAAPFRGNPEARDQFGAKSADVPNAPSRFLIGAPGETVGTAARAGAVTVIDVIRRTSHELTQATPGVPGAAEAGDWFGTPARR